MNRQVLTYARNHGIKESQPPERAGGEIKPSVRGMMMTMDNHNNDTDTLEALFALSREAVLGVREGRVTFGNAAAVRLFGREVRGESLAGLLPELETLPGEERFVTAADVGGTVYTVTAVPREGAAVLTLTPPEQDPAGLGAAVLSRLRMAAFRMRMSLDRLAEEAGEGETAQVAFHSYFEMLHRIDQLTDAGALSRGDLPCHMEPLELGELVQDLTESAAYFTESRGTQLLPDVPQGLFIMKGDRGRLEQLLLILLSNALLHTSAEGRVRVRLRRDGDRFYLTVEDTGEGMTDRDLAYAFALREDADPSDAAYGAGLGLYIAQGIARLHGGAIVLTSKPGAGTRVTVTLPGCPEACVRDLKPVPPTGPDRILSGLANLLPNKMYDAKYRD